MIDLPAPLVECGRRRLQNAFAIAVALGVAVAALTLVVVPKPPLPGDPMQPWVVALTLFVFIAVAPAILIRIALKKDAEVLAALRSGQRHAGTVTSRQGEDVVVKWSDDRGEHLARVAAPDAAGDVDVITANLAKIAIVVDGKIYLGVVI